MEEYGSLPPTKGLSRVQRRPKVELNSLGLQYQIKFEMELLEKSYDKRTLDRMGVQCVVGVERITTHPHTEPFSKITSHNIINLQNL